MSNGHRTKIDYTCVAADADGLATAAVCTGAGPWVPDVATSAGDGLAHLITITQVSATDHSLKTATITGTDSSGAAQTETIALPNGATTKTTTKYFLTVASVAISATISTDTMTMGWAVDAVTPWKTNEIGLNMGFGCTITDSPVYTVQYTYDGVTAFDHEDVATETTSQAGYFSFPFQAVRVKFAAAGGVKFIGLQY